MHQDPVNCDPDCTKGKTGKKQKRHEFVGPVKIVFVEPDPWDYRHNKCGSGFIALSYLLIGYTVISILLYTFRFDIELYVNLHVFLCTLGLFLPMSILTHNPVNGPSNKLKKCDRGSDHIMIGTFGAGCAVAGSVLIYLVPRYNLETIITSYHSALGFVSFLFLAAACLVGPISFWRKYKITNCVWKLHNVFGCLAFLVSSVCFCSALFRPRFHVWFSPLKNLIYFHVGFCAFYTFVIIFRPLRALRQEIYK